MEERPTFAQRYAAADPIAADKMLDNASVHHSDKGMIYEFTDGSLYVTWLENPVFLSMAELRSRMNHF